jgi:hypothetical protein
MLLSPVLWTQIMLVIRLRTAHIQVSLFSAAKHPSDGSLSDRTQ